MSKKIIFTDEQIAKVEELAKKYMPTDLIADYFGIKSSVFDEIKKRQPEVLAAYRRGFIENALNSVKVKLVLLGFLQNNKNTADKLKAIKIYKKYFENNDA